MLFLLGGTYALRRRCARPGFAHLLHRLDAGVLHHLAEVVIRVYANDHLPPHFHVAPHFEALVEIATLAILRGEIGRSARAEVMAWCAAHRADLAAEWNRINPRFPIA
jgi:hypothetical protein